MITRRKRPDYADTEFTEEYIRGLRGFTLLMRGWLFAVLFVLSLPAVTPRLYASDEVQYFAYLRSPWFDRDFSFENEYRWFYDAGVARSAEFHETFLERQTATGRRINFGTIGCALLWSPFYAAGDLTARVLAVLGSPVEVNGYSRPYLMAVALGSAFYGWLAVLLSLHIARTIVGDGVIPTLAVWFGTPLLFYMYVAPPMSHACSAFAVALFIAVWLRVRETWSTGGLIALGVAAALMAMVREQDVFFVIGPFLDLMWPLVGQLLPRRTRTIEPSTNAAVEPGVSRTVKLVQNTAVEQGFSPAIKGALVFGITFVLAFLPQLLAYIVLNGYPGPSQLVGRKMNWWAPHGLQVLASPSHGLFAWTPLAILACIGLIALAVRSDARWAHADARRIGLCALLMLVGQVYVAGSVESWTVAGAFGQRRFVALTPLLVLGLTVLWLSASRQTARVGLGIALVVCVWWNLGLMAQFGTGMMNRQQLELSANAYNTFVVVPSRLPELGFRYLFDRSSFYQQRP